MVLHFMTAGESHGPALVAILEGLPAGLPSPAESMNAALARRQRGTGSGPRMKLEKDQATILAGVMAGYTTGAPLAIRIENRDHAHWKGRPIQAFTIPRPGHADLAGAIKYGYPDLRPVLERASARETAARVAVGAACQLLLEQFDIHVGGYVVSIGDITAELDTIPLLERPERSLASPVSCPDPDSSARIEECIRRVTEQKDTLGGVIEVIAWGVPPGLGSYTQWDRRLDARLGAAILSIPAIKGVEIGDAFANTRLPGTLVQDAIQLEGDQLVRPTDHCGGLEGGLSTGQPIIIRAAMKPVASTLQPQPSVDLARGELAQTHYERSDFCPVPRAVPVLEAAVAFILADALLEKLGGDSLEEIHPRYQALRRACLHDLKMGGDATVYWPGEDAVERYPGENNAG